MKTEKSCGVVICRKVGGKAEFLVVKYAAGHWSLVKGHVEPGEAEEQTARREVLEETGVQGLAIKEGFKFQTTYQLQRNGHKVEKTVVFFLSVATPAQLSGFKLSKEHTDYKWLPIGEACKLVTYQTDRDVLTSAAEFLTG